MNGNYCHHCNQPVSLGHTYCPRCAQTTNCAVAPDRPPNVVARSFNDQQNVDGIADVLEALSVLSPAIGAALPIFWLTQIVVLALLGGVAGFVAACRFTPFGGYVKRRSRFIKFIASGLAVFAVVGVLGSFFR